MNSAIIIKRHADFAVECLTNYREGKSFTSDINSYFRARKSFGSRDRRRIRAMCYSWFRLGFTIDNLSKANQVLLAYLTLEQDPQFDSFKTELPFELPTDWQELNLESRLQHLNSVYDWNRESIFPMNGISKQLNVKELILHQLTQPLLWLSVSNERRRNVLTKLASNGVEAVDQKPALGVPISTPIQSILKNHEYEVQDYSSQSVVDVLKSITFTTVWDCCAGSGGKSLQLARMKQGIEVYASDIRPTILQNLRQRFKLHRLEFLLGKIDLNNEQRQLSFVRDNAGEESVDSDIFDLIIADVPCSGSATWNRNPEHVFGFKQVKNHLIVTQQNILRNAWKYLKPGGHLLYITCSVFDAENEKQIESFVKFSEANIVKSDYVEGYKHRSDSMYWAILRK
jgi:16S rRNA (cytosine967-C5)-methyltransferase